MYCINCGQPHSEAQKFCANCGNQLTNSVGSATEIAQTVTTKTVMETSKSLLATEVVTFLKVFAISLILAVIAVPIGLREDMEYVQGYLVGSDLQNYLKSNKNEHMRSLFKDTLIYSLIGLMAGRYCYKLVRCAQQRHSRMV